MSSSITNVPAGEFYRSQYNQDRFIYEYLLNFRNGVYFDVGAFEGEHISNTYFFEHYLGWSGILVEMQASLAETILRKRPGSKLFSCGIGPVQQKLLYLDAGDRSGLMRYIDHSSIVHIEEHYQNIEPKPNYSVYWIDVRPVSDLTEEAGVKHIDYFSLDVEGAEVMVLKSIDFSRLTVDLFTIEDHDLSWKEHRAILEPIGYTCIGEMEGDAYFLHDRLIKKLAKEHSFNYIDFLRSKLSPIKA